MMNALQIVTIRSIWRGRGVSVLLVAVVLAGVFSSMLLHNLIRRQEDAIVEMVENTTISCVVTNPQGTDSGNLQMISAFVDMLAGLRHERGCYLDEHVKNIRAVATTPLEAPKNYTLRRIYSLDSDPHLSPVEGASVQFFEGWEESVLKSRERVCLVGDNASTVVASDGACHITVELAHWEPVDLTVIGTVTGGPEGVIYVPFYIEFAQGISDAFSVDSCSFDIRDNTHLEESKAELYKTFIQPNLSQQPDGLQYGLLVQDETYLHSLEEMESNLTMLQLLLPVLMVLTCGIGFFSGYLATRGRRKEFAVMRCLGMNSRKIFAIVFGEQAILALLGGVAGLTLGIVLEGGATGAALARAGIMTAVFLIGAAIAVLHVTRVNTMELMKVED